MAQDGGSNKSVIIIGAGFSGLSAAHRLVQACPELQVLVVEAGGSVGGRCKRGVLPVSGPVELGATWFHGTINNPVFDLAVDFGVISRDAGMVTASESTEEESEPGGAGSPQDAAAAAAVDEAQAGAQVQEGPEQGQGQQQMSGEEAAPQPSQQPNGGSTKWDLRLLRMGEPQPLAGPEVAVAVAAMTEYADVVEELHGEDAAAAGTIGQALRAHIDEVLAGSSGATKAPIPEGGIQAYVEGWAVREKLQRAYDGFFSGDTSSTVFAEEYQDLEGPNIPVPGGYQALAEQLAAKLPEGTIRLNTRVKCVDYSQQEGAAVRVMVEGAAGEEELCADAVIVTVSLGVLKGGAAALFTPPLPAPKLAAIQDMHIGIVNKVFVEWPARDAPAGSPAQANTPSGSAAACAAAAAAAPLAAATQSSGGGGEGVVGPRKQRVDGSTSQPCSALQQWGVSADQEASLRSANFPPAVTRPSDALTTFCLMWPTDPAAWGSAAAPAGSWPAGEDHPVAGRVPDWVADMLPAQDPVYAPLPASEGAAQAGDAAEAAAAAALPLWVRALHSWRYGDGPEWIHGGEEGDSKGAGVRQPDRAAVLWIIGAAALAVESQPPEALAAHIGALLASFPAIPLPEGASPADEFKVYTSSWGTDPCFQGSYSYPGPRADVASVEALAAPLLARGDEAAPLVCFAGEATNRHHMGTVHGAYETGLREAQRLLGAWGLLA